MKSYKYYKNKYYNMKCSNYNILSQFPDIEYYIFSSPITRSCLDLADEIQEKFQVKVSPQTIGNYRKRMPRSKIMHLKEGRTRNIASLQFILDILKEQLKSIEDPKLKLKYSEEIMQIVKEIDALVDKKIEYLRGQ